MTSISFHSALIGEAHVFDGTAWTVVRPDGSREPGSEAQARWLFGLDPEAAPIATGEDPAAALARAVEEERTRAWTTACLDARLGSELRERLSRRVERALAVPSLAERLRDRFLGLPAPDAADLDGAVLAASDARATQLHALWLQVIAAQPAIHALADTLDAAVDRLPPPDQDAFVAVAATCDVVRRLAQALQGGDRGAAVLALARRVPVRVPTLQLWMKLAAERLGVARHDEARMERMRAGDAALRATVATVAALAAPVQKWQVDRARAEAVDRLRRGDAAGARALVDEVVSAQERAGQGEFAAKTLCAMASAAAAHPELAEAWLTWALATDAEDPVPAVQLLKLLRARGRAREAAERAEQVFVGRRMNAVAMNSWAEALAAAGMFDAAEARFRETQRLAPHDEVAWSGYAELLKARGRFDEAEAAYREAQRLAPHNEITWCGFAELLKARGRFDEAEAAYREAQRLAPHSAFICRGFAELLRVRGRFDEAEATFREAQRIAPHDQIAWSGLAEVLKARGRFDEAEAAYREAQRLAPHNEIAWCGFAELLKTRGRFDEAEAAFREAQRIAPHQEIAWKGFANLLKALGRFDEAEAAYREAQRLAPHDEVAWNGFAELLKARGRFDEAEDAYREAQRLAPHNEVTWTGFAELLKARGRFDEAEAAYRTAQRLARHDEVAWNGLAELLRTRGRFDEAEAAYRTAQRLAPHNQIAWNGFAELLKARGRFDEAEAAYREALRRTPHDSYARLGLALLRASRGDRAEADALLAVPGAPQGVGDWHLRRGQAILALRRGDLARARRIAEEGRTGCPFVAVRPLFTALLAAVAVRERRATDAIRLLATPEVDPTLDSTRRVVLLHAYAAAADRRAIGEARDLPTAGRTEVMRLRDALVARYGLAGGRPDTAQESFVLRLEEDLLAA